MGMFDYIFVERQVLHDLYESSRSEDLALYLARMNPVETEREFQTKSLLNALGVYRVKDGQLFRYARVAEPGSLEPFEWLACPDTVEMVETLDNTEGRITAIDILLADDDDEVPQDITIRIELVVKRGQVIDVTLLSTKVQPAAARIEASKKFARDMQNHTKYRKSVAGRLHHLTKRAIRKAAKVIERISVNLHKIANKL